MLLTKDDIFERFDAGLLPIDLIRSAQPGLPTARTINKWFREYDESGRRQSATLKLIANGRDSDWDDRDSLRKVQWTQRQVKTHLDNVDDPDTAFRGLSVMLRAIDLEHSIRKGQQQQTNTPDDIKSATDSDLIRQWMQLSLLEDAS